MRVLYLTSVDPSTPNGPGVNEREFLHALHSRSDVETVGILPAPLNAWPPELSRGEIRFTARQRLTNPLVAMRHQASQYRAVKGALFAEPFDLVVVRPTPFPLAAVRALTESGVPYVLKNVGPKLVTEPDRRLRGPARSLARLNRRLMGALFRDALMADTVSERQRTEFRAEFPTIDTPIEVIDNAVNTERFGPRDRGESRRRLGLERFTHIIGYAGNYPLVRGGTEIIDALPHLRAWFPGIGAVILGEGGEDELRELARARGVADVCVITGRVPFEEVPHYINALDLGVSILDRSQWGASEQKVRQYIACGRPVVVSPGSSSFVEEAGIGTVIDSHAGEALAGAARAWLSLSDPEWRSVSASAREFAVQRLSVTGALQARLSSWRAQLESREQKVRG